MASTRKDDNKTPRYLIYAGGGEYGRRVLLDAREIDEFPNRCPYCGNPRFPLRSAGRRWPYFACEACGHRLEID